MNGGELTNELMKTEMDDDAKEGQKYAKMNANGCNDDTDG